MNTDTKKTTTAQAQTRQVTKTVVRGKNKTADAPLPCVPRYGSPT
jgi:hypothetical protein